VQQVGPLFINILTQSKQHKSPIEKLGPEHGQPVRPAHIGPGVLIFPTETTVLQENPSRFIQRHPEGRQEQSIEWGPEVQKQSGQEQGEQIKDRLDFDWKNNHHSLFSKPLRI